MHGITETPMFAADAKAAGMTQDEIDDVISIVAADPTAGEIMVGTGGARKLRVKGRGKGKRGGFRVITYYGGKDIPVFLLNVFGKGEKSNLSDSECATLKAILAKLADQYQASVVAVARAKKGERK